ncbi:MAG: hypothetical protein ACHQEB_00265 [Chitinophagales bacterium]
MKQAILFLLTFFIISSVASAQAYEGSVEYDKKKQTAVIIEYAYSPDATEGAFVQKLEKMGYRAKEAKGIFTSDKGFRNYKAAVVSDVSNTSMDYVVKVERKSRKDKDVSVLYLILLKDGNNALSTDDDLKDKAKSFLNNLAPEVEAFNLELQIKDQEDVVSKAEKKLKNLKDDQASMEKKIKNLQDDLKTNGTDQEKTQQDIENQKVALEALKGKRKTN